MAVRKECIEMKRFVHIQNLLERSAFGVSDYIGDKLGVASSRVRLYFIYLSCATFGSPIIFYLFVAFWLNIKRYIHEKRLILRD